MEKKDSLAAVGVLLVGPAPISEPRRVSRFVFLVEQRIAEFARDKKSSLLVPGRLASQAAAEKIRQAASPILGQIESVLDDGLAKVGTASPGILPSGFLSLGLYRLILGQQESLAGIAAKIQAALVSSSQALERGGIHSAIAGESFLAGRAPGDENKIDLYERPCLDAFSALCDQAASSLAAGPRLLNVSEAPAPSPRYSR